MIDMIVAGLDVGFVNDPMAMVVIEKGNDGKIRLKRLATWKRFDWSNWKRDMQKRHDQLKIETIYIDSTNNQSVAYELELLGMWVEAVSITNPKKHDMITNAIKLLNTGDLVMPVIEKIRSPVQKMLVEELLSQMREQEYIHDSANARLTHPSGCHDDLLWALCLALYGVTLDDYVPPVISGYSWDELERRSEGRRLDDILKRDSEKGFTITDVKIRRPGEEWRDLY